MVRRIKPIVLASAEIPEETRCWTCPICQKGLPGHLSKHAQEQARTEHFKREHPETSRMQAWKDAHRTQAQQKYKDIWENFGHEIVPWLPLSKTGRRRQGAKAYCKKCRQENCTLEEELKRDGAGEHRCTPFAWDKNMRDKRMRPRPLTWSALRKAKRLNEYVELFGVTDQEVKERGHRTRPLTHAQVMQRARKRKAGS